jgi:hypothetical protein
MENNNEVLVIDPITDETETAESATVKFPVGETWGNEQTVGAGVARRLYASPSAQVYGEGSYTISRADYEYATR